MAVDTSKWKKDDLDAISAAGQRWTAANASGDKTAMDAAHADAERIRAQYGVTGGTDGSQLTKLPTAVTSGVTNQYTPLDNSGNNYAQMAGMSELHRAALEAAGNAYNAATTAEQRDAAHQQAESIRSLYGFSGGVDGSQYIATGAPSQGAYVDPYKARVDQLMDEITNRDAFSYNAESDPLYQQYRDQYIREGQRSMQDTLGQVSARTGGLASTYATSAAQQASDYYMSQLADKVPELYQAAYQMYLDDIGLKVQDLDLLQGASDTQYDRWRVDRDFNRGVFESDRDYDYGLSRDKIDDSRYVEERADQLARDKLAQENWLKEFGLDTSKFNYQKEKDAQGDGSKTPTPGKEPLDDGEFTSSDWAKINSLGLGPVNAESVAELMQYGGVVEKNGSPVWADGWTPQNYQQKLEAAKYIESLKSGKPNITIPKLNPDLFKGR